MITEWFRNKTVVSYSAKLLPLVILLLAAILRFHLIDHQSLWNDEGNSLRLAQRAIPDLLGAARLDIHPPGYYLALKAWLALTGDSEFALRALSALAGVLTTACVYALGRVLFAPGAGLLAALLVALNAFSVYYGQEARMYAALALWASASMLVFVRWLIHPSWKTGVTLAILNAAGLYTQYTYPVVMVVQGMMFVLWCLTSPPKLSPQRSEKGNGAVKPLSPSERGVGGEVLRRLITYLALNLLTFALFVPQLGTALAQVTAWPRTGQPVSLGDGLAAVIRWLIYGNTSNVLPWWAYVWPALFGLAAILPDWRRRPLASWWARLLPWLWLLISVVPLFALGLFREANLKFLLPAQIATTLLVGRGVWLLWEIGSPNLFILVEAAPRLLAGIGLLWQVSASADSLNNLYTASQYARPDYRAIARLIATNPRPDDAIILDAPNQREVFTYYYHGSAPTYALPAGLGGDDAATAKAVQDVIKACRRIYVLYWGETERDPNRIVQKSLSTGAFEVRSTWYGDVRFAQYATMPPTAGITRPLNVRFGDSILLQQVALSAETVLPGDVLGVTFDWSAAQPLTRRYKVFVQLLDGQGQLIAQHDGEPGNNLNITTTWQPGQVVSDSHGLIIPADLVPGDYHLIAGLYEADNPSSRLPVGGGDHFDLGVIKVTAQAAT